MFTDTHCHLNFSRFKKNVEEVIIQAHEAGVTRIVVPGTDVQRSQGAIDIAASHENIYAAVGIHPHHVYEFRMHQAPEQIEKDLAAIEGFLKNEKVVAVGEIGMDRHVYEQTKYGEYAVDEGFIELQKQLFVRQVRFAVAYGKSLIIHNREAKDLLLPLLHDNWDTALEGRTVFHCCEPDAELVQFAREHHMYIGIDGDITYSADKQQFIPTVPLEMLVLETDSPFLLPEPMRARKEFPNKPSNIPLIAQFVAYLRKIAVDELARATTQNALSLFRIS